MTNKLVKIVNNYKKYAKIFNYKSLEKRNN